MNIEEATIIAFERTLGIPRGEVDLSKTVSDYNGDSLDVFSIALDIESMLGIEFSDEKLCRVEAMTGRDYISLGQSLISQAA